MKTYYSFFLILLLTSCGSNNIEDQVEEIVRTSDKEEINEIAYSLADSLDLKASKLLIDLHPKQTIKPDGTTDFIAIATERRVRWALQGLISRFSAIKDSKREICLSYITDPNFDHNLSNDEKIEFILYGLNLNNTDKEFQTVLANSALKHGDDAMLKLIEEWKGNKSSKELLNAINIFDQKVLNHLSTLIEEDKNAIDLLARIGEPAISMLKRMMRSKKQSVRFAAGDVLVKMIEYHPDALTSLTSAINKNGVRTIAKNYPFYIRLGQSGSEQILIKALRYNFNITMCVDYLNCGSKTIEDGATKIAKDNGYTVTSGFGSHSGPIWGSGG
jgi:hypothetical protein